MGTRYLTEAVLTSTHNLCFEQRFSFFFFFFYLGFHFLMVKFSIYLNKRVFVMHKTGLYESNWRGLIGFD